MYNSTDIQNFVDTANNGSQDWETNTIEILLFAKHVAQARNDTKMLNWLNLEIDGYTEPKDIDYRKIPSFEIGNSIFELLALCNYSKLDPFNMCNHLVSIFADAVSEKFSIDKMDIAKIIDNKTEEKIYSKEILEKIGEILISHGYDPNATRPFDPSNEDMFFIGDNRLTLTGNDDRIDVKKSQVEKSSNDNIVTITSIFFTSVKKASDYLDRLANPNEQKQTTIKNVGVSNLCLTSIFDTVVYAKHVAQDKKDIKALKWLQSELNGYDQPQNLEHRFIHGYEVGNSLFELVGISHIDEFDQRDIMTNRLSYVTSELEKIHGIPYEDLHDIIMDIYPESSIKSFNLYDGRLKLINASQNVDSEDITFKEIDAMLGRISQKAHDYLNSFK